MAAPLSRPLLPVHAFIFKDWFGPLVTLNRAAAVAEVEGPGTALAIVDGLELGDYHLFHAIRADLLRRLGRTGEAALAYQTAIARTENSSERDFLKQRRRALRAGSHLAGIRTMAIRLDNSLGQRSKVRGEREARDLPKPLQPTY